MQNKIYVVIDTNIFISALLKIESYPGTILKEIFNERFVLLLNQEIWNEYREVMSRPKFAFSSNMIDEFLEILEQYSLYVKEKKCDLKFNDIKDKVFYEVYKTKVHSGEVYLITGNMKHFPAEKNIISPKEFVEKIINM